MPPRSLRLKSERLAELTTDDLTRVAGGQALTVADKCASALWTCPTFRFCTTAPSCTCEPSWNCQ